MQDRPEDLSLSQPAPAGWRQDRPAFPEDPFMDWESETERPPRGPFEPERTRLES